MAPGFLSGRSGSTKQISVFRCCHSPCVCCGLVYVDQPPVATLANEFSRKRQWIHDQDYTGAQAAYLRLGAHLSSSRELVRGFSSCLLSTNENSLRGLESCRLEAGGVR